MVKKYLFMNLGSYFEPILISDGDSLFPVNFAVN
jgi:hypothetical protein